MCAAGAGERLGAGLGRHRSDRGLDPLRRLGGQTPCAEQAAGGRDLGHTAEDLVGGQLAVAPGPENAEDDGDPPRKRRRRRQHDRVAQRAAESGLAAVGEHVPADVDEHHQVALQVGRRGRDAVLDRHGSAVDVEQDDRFVQRLGQPRLGEAHAAARARPRTGERDRRGEALGIDHLDERPGSRLGVDRRALPRRPADHGGAPAAADQLSRGERPDHVPASADAQAQDPPGAVDEGVEAGQVAIRRRPGPRRRRSRRSPRTRDRTRRRRAPACPRRAGRGAARATSDNRRTRRAP